MQRGSGLSSTRTAAWETSHTSQVRWEEVEAPRGLIICIGPLWCWHLELTRKSEAKVCAEAGYHYQRTLGIAVDCRPCPDYKMWQSIHISLLWTMKGDRGHMVRVEIRTLAVHQGWLQSWTQNRDNTLALKDVISEASWKSWCLSLAGTFWENMTSLVCCIWAWSDRAKA